MSDGILTTEEAETLNWSTADLVREMKQSKFEKFADVIDSIEEDDLEPCEIVRVVPSKLVEWGYFTKEVKAYQFISWLKRKASAASSEQDKKNGASSASSNSNLTPPRNANDEPSPSPPAEPADERIMLRVPCLFLK
jgi:hypothetical protein